MNENNCKKCNLTYKVVKRGLLKTPICDFCNKNTLTRYKNALKKYPKGKFTLDDFYTKKFVRLAPKRGRKSKAYHSAKQQVELSLRTPKWVNSSEIAEIYDGRPKGFEVDHIIPLRGEDVSGLHVPWNLRYLTRSANNSKSNKFDPDYIETEPLGEVALYCKALVITFNDIPELVNNNC